MKELQRFAALPLETMTVEVGKLSLRKGDFETLCRGRATEAREAENLSVEFRKFIVHLLKRNEDTMQKYLLRENPKDPNLNTFIHEQKATLLMGLIAIFDAQLKRRGVAIPKKRQHQARAPREMMKPVSKKRPALDDSDEEDDAHDSGSSSDDSSSSGLESVSSDSEDSN